jgi:hypothetical protein
MKRRVAQLLSALSLIVTLGPPCLFFADQLNLAETQRWMLGAAVLWFLATPFWMEHKAVD